MTEHINTHQLLEFRSGLLDDSPKDIDYINEHLTSCKQCQSHWQELDAQFSQAAMSASQADEQSLNQQLAERRQAALNSHLIHNQKPRYALIAAAMFVAVGAGVIVSQQLQNREPNMIDLPVTLGTDDTEVEELVSSVDFFLWMDEIEQQESEG